MRDPNDFNWNDESVAKLRQMVEVEGYSGGQVAQAWGVTRNTVCAKINRLGLERGKPSDLVRMAATISEPGRKSRAKPPEERKPKPKAPVKQRFTKAHAPKPATPRALPANEPTTATAVTTLDVGPGMCRWPLNDGKPEWLHCGAAADDGPYCEFHHRKSRNPSAAAERKAA